MILIFNPNGWCLQVRWRYWIWSKVALEEEALRRCRKELRKGTNCSKCALVLSHSCALAVLRARTTIELMQSTSARWKAKTSTNSSSCALLVEDLRYWIWSKVALEEEALRKCRVLELTWCLCLSSMEICSCELENRSRLPLLLHAFAQFSTLGIHLCNLALNSYSASSISVSQLIRRFLAILNDASVDDDIPGIPRRLHHGSIFYLLHLAQPPSFEFATKRPLSMVATSHRARDISNVFIARSPQTKSRWSTNLNWQLWPFLVDQNQSRNLKQKLNLPKCWRLMTPPTWHKSWMAYFFP